MRQLILLRHAHAEPAAPGQADLDRPLSPEGLAEAEAAGRWLAEHDLVPDCVLCSPSRRTRETLEAVLGAIGYVEQRLEPSIYEGTAGTLVALADRHCDAERLLVVGHNPGLERLVALLSSGQSGDYRGMPPGAVAVLGMPADAAIEPGAATLAAFWWP
jgi:phosphohistidine phosphatase SixA